LEEYQNLWRFSFATCNTGNQGECLIKPGDKNAGGYDNLIAASVDFRKVLLGMDLSVLYPFYGLNSDTSLKHSGPNITGSPVAI
jgi:hypothetical protein